MQCRVMPVVSNLVACGKSMRMTPARSAPTPVRPTVMIDTPNRPEASTPIITRPTGVAIALDSPRSDVRSTTQGPASGPTGSPGGGEFDMVHEPIRGTRLSVSSR